MPPAPETFVQLCRTNNIAAVPANQRLRFIRDAATLMSKGLPAKCLAKRCAALSWARDYLQNSLDPNTWPTLLTPALSAYLQGMYTIPPHKGARPAPSNLRRPADIITLYSFTRRRRGERGKPATAPPRRHQHQPPGRQRGQRRSSATTSSAVPELGRFRRSQPAPKQRQAQMDHAQRSPRPAARRRLTCPLACPTRHGSSSKTPASGATWRIFSIAPLLRPSATRPCSPSPTARTSSPRLVARPRRRRPLRSRCQRLRPDALRLGYCHQGGVPPHPPRPMD